MISGYRPIMPCAILSASERLKLPLISADERMALFKLGDETTCPSIRMATRLPT